MLFKGIVPTVRKHTDVHDKQEQVYKEKTDNNVQLSYTKVLLYVLIQKGSTNSINNRFEVC